MLANNIEAVNLGGDVKLCNGLVLHLSPNPSNPGRVCVRISEEFFGDLVTRQCAGLWLSPELRQVKRQELSLDWSGFIAVVQLLRELTEDDVIEALIGIDPTQEAA